MYRKRGCLFFRGVGRKAFLKYGSNLGVFNHISIPFVSLLTIFKIFFPQGFWVVLKNKNENNKGTIRRYF